MDPLSCLAHESSSLCSFQGTRLCGSERRRSHHDERIACASRSVPSKLNSAALEVARLSADRLRRADAHGPIDRFAPALLALDGNSHYFILGDPRCGGRATEGEKPRALRSHPHLSRDGRANPDLKASSVVDSECPPLRSRRARTNDMDSLERR